MSGAHRGGRRWHTALAGPLLLAALVAAGVTALPLGAGAATAAAQTAPAKKAPAKKAPAKKPAAKKKAPAKKPAAAKPAAPAPAPPVEQPAPIDTSHVVWTEARKLADQERYPEALDIVRGRLRRDPDNVELRWLEAGIRGWMGRPSEAVTLYELLISDHPEVASSVRGDLAAARLEAGDPAGALRDLDLRLAEVPTDRDARERRARALAQLGRLDESLAGYDALLAGTPGDSHLLMERARVLMWMGRNRDAAAVYQQVLDKDPGNRGARLGLAMNENFQGRHRVAAAQLESLAAEPNADPEATKQLAFARYWNGEPEAARLALQRYLRVHPDDREALQLEAQMDGERGRSVTGSYVHSNDTEDLKVDTWSMTGRFPLLRQSMVELMWRQDRAEDPGGIREPWQLGGAIETIWSALLSTRADIRHAELGDDFGDETLGGLLATWRPEERVRVDAGVERDLVFTRIALDNRIAVRTWSGGVDWRVTPRVNVIGSGAWRGYSDGNDSHTLSGRAVWRAYAKNHLRIAPRISVERLEAREDPGHGYYAPAQYTEWGPGAEAEWTPRPDVTLTGNLMLGWQRELGSEWDSFVNGSGRFAWTVHAPWTLVLEGGQSNSDLSTAAGYERRYWGASLSTGF